MFLPTSAKEVQSLGWDYLDVILFTGDAYIDHPSFGASVIGRTLEQAGYRVAIVPQPNWRDDLRDFKKLGTPRLFFGVTAGAMDSMVNHYTPTRRIRSNDAYTPNDKAGMRPDYATVVYAKILKELFPDSLVVLGGIEASLRRTTHYDYWQDELKPSILIDSGADAMVYGMGEKSVVELTNNIKNGTDWREIKQIAYISNTVPQTEHILLNSYEQCLKDKRKYGENFVRFETESNKVNSATLVEQCGNKYVIINPSIPFFTTEEIDRSFDLPYERLPHPRYKDKPISAYEMIKHSVNIHRGCFGGCSFCAIAAHQGKFISSRSTESILSEIDKISSLSNFQGNLSDVGGPSANMWQMRGKDLTICAKCSRASCIFPKKCINLQNEHKSLINLYNKIIDKPKVKKMYVSSGIRYDLFDDTTNYLEQIITKHTSGRLKVAPEHTEKHVLDLMRKPSFSLFETIASQFNTICTKHNLKYQIVPYFISSHPACTLKDMQTLTKRIKNIKNIFIEPVQDFTPTPSTLSTAIYYLGFNPYNKEKVFNEKSVERKNIQKQQFFKNKY